MKHIILSLILLFAAFAATAQQTPDCQAPEGLVISNLTSTSANISWALSAGHDAPSVYTLTLKDQSRAVIYQDNALVAPTLSYTLTGLTQNTTYIVELTGNCNASSSGYSTTATITFTTLCGARPVPYTEDFDTLTALPSCTFSHNATVSYVGRYGKGITLRSTVNDGAYIVFPELTINSNNVECNLWLKASTVAAGNIPVQVGLVTDPSDFYGSFEPIYSGELTDLNWKEIQMNTTNTRTPVTSGAIIAVNVVAGFAADVYLDDVSIHQVPTCIRPEDFTVSNVLSTSALLSWTTTNAPNTRIYVTSTEGSTSVLATTSPYTLTNLTPNTAYTVSIRGICSATDSSELCRQSIAFTTKCAIAPTPLFHETFDTLTVANTIPVCWESDWITRTTDLDAASPFTSSTYQVHTGTRAMKLIDQPTGATSYLSSQLLPIDSAGKYTLSVWVYRQNASQYQMEALRFWVAPSYNTTAGATLLGIVPLHFQAAPAEPTANLWYNYEYVIPTSGDRYILVEGISESGASLYFDDVEVKLTPSCMKVSNVRLSGITSSGANLQWTPGNTESQWAVDYTLTSNAQIIATESDTVAFSALSIDNLSPATVYSITGQIRAICSASDTAVAVPFSYTFTTSCLPLTTLPYSCGFESSEMAVMANPMPLCWQRLNDASTASNASYPNVSASADISRTGSGSLRFFPSNSGIYNYGSYQMAVLPEVDATYPINTLHVSFYARTQDAASAHNFIVGAISNPADVSTFVPIDSFAVSGNFYRRHDVLFDTYTGTGRYMALMVRRSSTGAPVILVDDLVVDVIPTCRDILGNGVEVSLITDVAARIAVTDTTATTWQYAYGVAGTPVAALTPVTASSSTAAITGLIPSTTYSVYARRVCGTTYGNWCDAVNFTTACSAASVPFVEDFESQPLGTLHGCFVVEAGNSEDSLQVFTSTAGAVPNQTFNHTTSGSRGIASSDGTLLDPVTSHLKANTFVHLEADRNYEISLYAKKYAHNYYEFAYHLTFTLGTTLANLTAIGNHSITGTNFERYASTFTAPFTGNFYIGFQTTANISNPEYYVFIDDIRVEEIACTAPVSVQVSDLTASTASLNITSTGSSWIVAVSAFPIDIDGTVTGDVMYDTVTTNVVNLTGLLSNADYYYTVRSLCPNGETSVWTAPGTFHTRCTNAAIPYFEGFERAGSTSCWSALGSGTVARSTTTSYAGAASMSLSRVTVISPMMNVISLAPYMLSMQVYSTSVGASVSVGVMNDPDDVSSLEMVATFPVTAANRWTEMTALFDILNDPEYADFYNARYVAISVSGNTAICFDDITIDFPPTCPKPSSGTISGITTNSVTLDWTEAGTATSWRIRLVPASGSEVTQTVTTHPYTVTGLNPSLLYNAYVSAICSPGDLSPEANLGSFSTSCGVVTAPYSEDFECQTVKTTPSCWSIVGSSFSSVERNWGVHSISGNRSIRMSNWGLQNGNALINTPQIYIPAGQTYELAYDYAHQSTSGPLLVKIRRSSESTFTTLDSRPNSGISTTEDNLPLSFQPASVSLAAYAGDTVTIQFFNTADDIYGEGSIFVDNVRVRVYNPCSEPTFKLTSLSDVAASFRITDTLHTTWQYAYGAQGFDVASAQVYNTTSNAISLTGLTGFTFYDIYVRAVCGGASYSDWHRLTFNTTSYVTPLPYYTDFSNPADNNLWQKEGDEQNAFVFGTDPSALINSTHALYVSSDGLHYNYDVNVDAKSCISRLFNFEDKVYDIEFDWKCPGGKYVLNGVVDYGRFYLMPAYANPLPEGEGMYYHYYFWDDDMIPLDGDTCLHLVSGNQHASVIVDMNGRAGAYRLVYFWFTESGGSTAPTPLSVANLSIEPLACDPVTNLVVPAETITATSAVVHCDNTAPALRWVVSSSSLLADSVMSGTSANSTFTINGLSPSRRHYLLVRAECSDSAVSPWTTVVFNTLCGPVTVFPHTEDFEDATFPPYCWSASGWSRYTNRPYQYAHGGGCAHAGFQQNQNLISPELMLEADRQYFIRFWLFRSNLTFNTDQLKVYVSPSTSLNDATLLQSFITYEATVTSDALVEYTIDLPEGLSGVHYIIFSASGANANQTVYLDDITFGIYPICRDMKSAPVITAHTATTVSLSSEANNYTSTQYGIAPYSAAATPADITMIIDTCCFTGLTPNTSYSIFARGICSFSGDTTGWSPAVKVTTRLSDCFIPDGIRFITPLSDTLAVIGWNAVPDAAHYQVVLTSAVGSDTVVTAATSCRFFPLVANTSYTFAVRALCADTTDWAALNFTTLRTPATIPYHTGFEPTDDNSLWHTISSAFTNFVIGTDGGGRHAGSQGLYMSSDGNTYSQTYPSAPGYSHVYGSAYITRTLYFYEPGTYEVAYDWKCDPISSNSYGYYDAYGRAYITPVNATLPVDVVTYSTAYPEGAIEVVSKITGSQSWQRQSVVVTVPEAGYRDLVFQWYSFNKYGSADEYELSDYPLAIDNLSVERVHCLTVNNLTTLAFSDSTAVVAAERTADVMLEYAVLTVNNQDSIHSVSTVWSDTIRLSGLSPLTQYYLFVRQVCDSLYSSSWSSISFTTTNAPAVLPYVCDFEDVAENNLWIFHQNQQNQLVIGTSAYGDGTGALYVSSDGASNTYNNTVESYAYATRTFYLTPATYYCSFDWRNLGEVNHDYARLFLYPADRTLPVGSHLPDLGPAYLPYSAMAVDGGSQLSGNAAITNTECNFTVASEGSYNLVASWVNDSRDGINPPFVLDNIKMHETNCFAPAVNVVTDDYYAVLTSPDTGMDVLYAVSRTPDFGGAVFMDTIRNFSGIDTVNLSGISSATTYYFLCRSLCSADDYSLVSATQFRTPCGVITDFPYRESFESISTTYVSGMISDICWTAYGATSGNPRYVATTVAANVTDGSRALQLYAHRTNALTLALPEMADISSLRLYFDVIYEASKNMPTLTAGYLTDRTDASSFVAVTATTVSTTRQSYVVTFPNAPAGATIAFRFVGGNTNGKSAFLDNVNVLHVIDGSNYSDTICYGEGYNLNGFALSAASIPVGVSVHSRTAYATLSSDPDTIHTLTLLKRSDAILTFYDTICGGTPYVQGIWNIPNPSTRRYHQLFPGASVYGCDSTVELFLNVIPASNIIYDTICDGDVYQFGRLAITTAGRYTRTYQGIRGCTTTDTLYLAVVEDSLFDRASVCYASLPYRWNGQNCYTTGRYTFSHTGPRGCPQVDILDLTVFAADTTVNASLCAGGSVLVVDTVISAPGTYVLHRINPSGCDVNYHITVTEVPIVPEDVYDIACQGKPYTGYGITALTVTADTVVTITTRSISGLCDSIAHIHLTYSPTQYGDTTAYIAPGGSFTWRDQTYNSPGDYHQTLHDVNGCDSIVTLHLVLGSGVEEVPLISVNVIPNPVSVGATAYIYGNIVDLAEIEILNAYGQVIERFMPVGYPVEIPGISASGVYYVRLTTTDGKVAVRKLIVK